MEAGAELTLSLWGHQRFLHGKMPRVTQRAQSQAWLKAFWVVPVPFYSLSITWQVRAPPSPELVAAPLFGWVALNWTEEIAPVLSSWLPHIQVLWCVAGKLCLRSQGFCTQWKGRGHSDSVGKAVKCSGWLNSLSLKYKNRSEPSNNYNSAESWKQMWKLPTF